MYCMLQPLFCSDTIWVVSVYLRHAMLFILQSDPFGLNDTCPGCRTEYSAGAVSNQLTIAMRKHIKEYYMVRRWILDSNLKESIRGRYSFILKYFKVKKITELASLFKHSFKTFNVTGMAKMRRPFLWLHHSPGAPDTSAGRPHVHVLFQGSFTSSGK